MTRELSYAQKRCAQSIAVKVPKIHVLIIDQERRVYGECYTNTFTSLKNPSFLRKTRNKHKSESKDKEQGTRTRPSNKNKEHRTRARARTRNSIKEQGHATRTRNQNKEQGREPEQEQ